MSNFQENIGSSIPRHIAIILDGNGRWAERQNLSRSEGHVEGAKRVEEVVYAASDLGVQVLTLYTFSTENWKRPENEVHLLMRIICHVLERKVASLMQRNIRFNFIGKRDGVPQQVLKHIEQTIEKTKNNTGLILNMAFNYGSRKEILDAVRSVARDVNDGKLDVDDISEEMFSQRLYTDGLPDPDLLVRTSGEKRISNFLLWQISYSELYFTDKFWPEFTKEEFEKAICDFQVRERRYGEIDASQN